MVKKARRVTRGGRKGGGGLAMFFLLLGAFFLAIGLVTPCYAHSMMAAFFSTITPGRVVVEVPGAGHVQALCSDGKRYEGWDGVILLPRYSYCYVQPHGYTPFKVSTYVDEKKITVYSEPKSTLLKPVMPFASAGKGGEPERPSGGSCNIRVVVWDEELKKDVTDLVPDVIPLKIKVEGCKFEMTYPGIYNPYWSLTIDFEASDIQLKKDLPTKMFAEDPYLEGKWVDVYYVIYLTAEQSGVGMNFRGKAYLYPPGKIVSYKLKGYFIPHEGYISEIWVGDLHGYHPATMAPERFYVNWDTERIKQDRLPYDGIIFPYGRTPGCGGSPSGGNLKWSLEFPPGTSVTFKVKLKGVRTGYSETKPGSYALLKVYTDPWLIERKPEEAGLPDPEGYRNALRKLQYFKWLNKTDPEKFKEVAGRRYEAWKYLISLPDKTARDILRQEAAGHQIRYDLAKVPSPPPPPEKKTYEQLLEVEKKTLSEPLKQSVQAKGGKVYEDFDGDAVVEKAVVPERDPVTGETVDIYIPPEGQTSVQQVEKPVLPEHEEKPSPLNLFTILGALFTLLGFLGMIGRW